MLAEGYLKANQIFCHTGRPCAHRDGDFTAFVAGAAGSRLDLHSCYSNITAIAVLKGSSTFWFLQILTER